MLSEAAFPSAVAELLVNELRRVLDRKAKAVFCPSAGRTVKPIYALLRDRYAEVIDWNRIVCVQMDEYEGLGCRHPDSFCLQLTSELVDPLAIGRFLHFNDEVGSLRLPLDRYEGQIAELGGIDIALRGIGVNGHIGFNEPLSDGIDATRKAALHVSTKESNNVRFDHAFTLGMQTLVAADVSIVAIAGPLKRFAAERLIFGPISAENPVSMLRAGRCVSVMLDEPASPVRLKDRLTSI